MSGKHILSNPALKDHNMTETNEEWTNFLKKVGEVSGLVKDMASGDKEKADAAQALADKYLKGKVITDDDLHMTIKHDRTVINQKAFQSSDKKDTVSKHYYENQFLINMLRYINVCLIIN